MLATMCITEPDLPKAAELTLDNTLIRLTMGQLAFLEKQLQQQQQSLAQYEETYAELGLESSETQQALRAHCKALKRLRKQFEKELEALLMQSQLSDDKVCKLRAIPGFSPMVAGLVGRLIVMSKELTHGQPMLVWILASGKVVAGKVEVNSPNEVTPICANACARLPGVLA